MKIMVQNELVVYTCPIIDTPLPILISLSRNNEKLNAQ